jgi:hypothetical protein
MNAVAQNKSQAIPASDERKSKTDWERLKTMTDDEIKEATLSDPDSAPIFSKEEMKRRYKLTPPRIHKKK